jgi:hypothetical protein
VTLGYLLSCHPVADAVEDGDNLADLIRIEDTFHTLRAEIGERRVIELRGRHPAALRQVHNSRMVSHSEIIVWSDLPGDPLVVLLELGIQAPQISTN